MRVLALCARRLDDEEDMYDMEKKVGLIFLGLIGIMDPPRPEVKMPLQYVKKPALRSR